MTFLDDGEFDNEPAQTAGKAKYCGYRTGCHGLYNQKSFRTNSSLSKPLLDALVKAANNGLSNQTW